MSTPEAAAIAIVDCLVRSRCKPGGPGLTTRVLPFKVRRVDKAAIADGLAHAREKKWVVVSGAVVALTQAGADALAETGSGT